MSTNREIVSRIRSTHKLLSSDARITDRAILAEANSAARVFIKQYTNQRKLWETDTIFTTIPCLEMEPVPLSSCCDFKSDRYITRSKEKLPPISEGNYQYLIKGVFNIEGDKELIYTPIKRYINMLRLSIPVKGVFYWIEQNRLFSSSPFVKTLTLSAYFEGDIPETLLNPPCECENRGSHDPCTNPLDNTFKCPGFLEEAVVDKVSNSLLTRYFRVPDDHTQDFKNDQTNKQ